MLKVLNLNLIKRMSFIFVFFVMFFGAVSSVSASGSSDESSSGIGMVCSINQNDELGCWSQGPSLNSLPDGFNTNIKKVSVWDNFVCVIDNADKLMCDEIGSNNGRLSFDLVPEYWKKILKT